MHEDALPIACSLSAAELPKRLAEMTDLGRAALVDATASATRAELRFAATAGVRERVEAVVAAESQCCAFLDMKVIDGPDTVALTIAVPDDAEQVLAELVAAFRGQPRGAQSASPPERDLLSECRSPRSTGIVSRFGGGASGQVQRGS
jgi:hypothetical protein